MECNEMITLRRLWIIAYLLLCRPMALPHRLQKYPLYGMIQYLAAVDAYHDRKNRRSSLRTYEPNTPTSQASMCSISPSPPEHWFVRLREFPVPITIPERT